MLLKFKPFHGPLNYRFKDPNTGFKFEASSEKELISRIRSYRSQNNLEPLEFLEAVIENYLCHQPENAGGCTPRGEFKRGIFAYLKGGIVLLQNLMYSSFAPQEVADARSAQCKDCKFNVFPDRDKFIKWSDDIAIASVGDRRSAGHESLGNCEVCSCPLRAKVFFAGKVSLSETEQSEMRTVNCWQLNILK